MPAVELELDIDDAFKRAMKQVLFGARGAITDVLFDARTAVQQAMMAAFILRRRHAIAGVRVVRATKNTDGMIAITRSYMAAHVISSQSETTRLHKAVPHHVRSNIKQVVNRKRWPGQMRDGKFFTVKKGSHLQVWKRTGRRRNRGKQLQWTIPQRIMIPQRFDFIGIVVTVIRENLRVAVIMRVHQAFATAR
jgi:hypothetical protein